MGIWFWCLGNAVSTVCKLPSICGHPGCGVLVWVQFMRVRVPYPICRRDWSEIFRELAIRTVIIRYKGGCSINANIKIASRGGEELNVGEVHVFVWSGKNLEVEIFVDHVGDDVTEVLDFNCFSSRLCYLNSFCTLYALLAITNSSILIIFRVHTAQNDASGQIM